MNKEKEAKRNTFYSPDGPWAGAAAPFERACISELPKGAELLLRALNFLGLSMAARLTPRWGAPPGYPGFWLGSYRANSFSRCADFMAFISATPRMGAKIMAITPLVMVAGIFETIRAQH